MVNIVCYFYGRVQGVGFRATVAGIAHRFAVSGCVQNMADGSVKLVAEGASEDVDEFVRDINERMRRNIDNYAIDRGEYTGEFGEPTEQGFFIRY